MHSEVAGTVHTFKILSTESCSESFDVDQFAVVGNTAKGSVIKISILRTLW